MKKIAIVLSACALAMVSCVKETAVISPFQEKMSFEASMPEVTKTTIDGLNVKWAADDKIKVYGVTGTTVQKAVFELKSGAGESTAVFTLKEGETMGTHTNYYAVYPSTSSFDESKLIEATPSLTLTGGLDVDNQVAVENGYDPKFALMTAVVDEGKLKFTYGVSYFKIKMFTDGITEVKVESLHATAPMQKRPVFDLDGTLIGSNGNTKTATSKGDFVKDSYYYIAVIPRVARPFGNLKITFTKGGVSNSITSNAPAITALEMVPGSVYNLGSPSVSFAPAIDVVAPSKLEADATAGSFTYDVVNPDGVSVVTAVKKSGDWISNVAASAGTVTFDCTVNTGEERTAVITLSYAGAEDVDVTVTQKAAGGSASEDYVWDFSSSAWTTVLASKGASNTDITNWVSTVDGLTWTSTAKSKWNTRTISGTTYTYIQTGGKGSASDRCFSFTVSNAGTLTVTTTGTSSTADETRKCTVKVGSADEVSKTGGSAQDELTVNEFAIDAGEVKVYPTGNALRFFKIEFHSN